MALMLLVCDGPPNVTGLANTSQQQQDSRHAIYVHVF